jgi:hypothetical protein
MVTATAPPSTKTVDPRTSSGMSTGVQPPKTAIQIPKTAPNQARGLVTIGA